MAGPEIELLGRILARFLRRRPLRPDERRELLHVARGLGSRDSAQLERVSVESVRIRRKVLYRKLGISGANELISELLALSLAVLAGRASLPGRRRKR